MARLPQPGIAGGPSGATGGPLVGAVVDGGRLVLHGLIHRAAAAMVQAHDVKGARALLRAIEGLQGYGVNATLKMQQEAERVLGDLLAKGKGHTP